jgi:2,5-diamino-6-(ribosylamino)-4(3H)-pyrimidinone 5'-phosphate reductase
LTSPARAAELRTPSLFDAAEKRLARRLRLLAIEPCKGDAVWLRYKVRRGRTKR